ncbi:MAG TPA: Ig-like domain-containing protein, partial [Thermoanaerobaculia bacterium]|nr:Ig-like domain-containing protein [Thermoanaerobaculia bacterium]
TMTLTTSASTPVGTYTITVTGTGGGKTHTTTVSLTVTAGGGVTTLTNGQPVTGLSGATNSWQYFKITVPSGQTSLVIPISGGTGDADLYVKLGAQPTSTVYDYRSIVSGNSDSVTVTNPAAGDWYIGLFGYAAYSGVTLTATYSGSSGDTTPPTTSITAPTSGATVSGTTSVTASASDNVGVTKVEFYLDGALASTDTSSPYSWSWNTTTASNASHSLSTKAYDAAGNVGTSATVTVTVNNATAQQLLGNPGFETGTASPWVTSTGVVSNSTSEPPHGGSWDAWMDGYGTTHTDTVYQQVAIPSTVTSATLTFWLHIDTAETSTTTAYDTLTVQIRNSSGTVLATLATYSNLNKNTGYTQKSFDLTSYKGQTIQVYLVGAEDSTLQTSFVVDDFALTTQ